MELTAEMFRQIVEERKAQAGIAHRNEQRRAPRTRLEMNASLMPFSDCFGTDTVQVPLRDLSRGGFRFLFESHIPLGEQFAMVLPEASGRPIVILCTVTYYQPMAEDLFAIGARFSRVLRQGEAGLPLKLEDAVSGEVTELRKAS